ncbi:esterase [Rhodococcus opacus PD630]|nr:Esterase [Rhodococcus opacus PD630]EHI47134.1 esterase [Rhodococcus opacus PD630]
MGRTKLRTAEDTRRDVHATSLRPASFNPPPSPLLPGVRLSADRTRGFPVFTIEPDSGRYGRTVIDFHGGAYVREIVSFHWLFARTITVAASVRLLLPIYPLAPHRTAARTVADAADIVESAISTQGAGNVAVVGDSAGGGIALAAAQELKRRGAPQPSRLILLSPWLDVTMSDPAQATIEKRDILLARGGLKEAGRLYAGDLEVTDWRVSPLFGDLTGRRRPRGYRLARQPPLRRPHRPRAHERLHRYPRHPRHRLPRPHSASTRCRRYRRLHRGNRDAARLRPLPPDPPSTHRPRRHRPHTSGVATGGYNALRWVRAQPQTARVAVGGAVECADPVWVRVTARPNPTTDRWARGLS